MIQINQEKCMACGLCVKDCIARKIEMVEGKAAVNDGYCLLCGHCIAICPQNAFTMDDYPMEDVKEYNKNTMIEPEHLLDFIKFRRSVRHFKKEQIADEKLLKVIEAGRYTATGSNRQDVKYIVVRDKLPEVRRLALEKLSEVTTQQAKQNSGFTKLAEKWTNMLESDREMPGKDDGLFFQAPTVVLLVSDSPTDAALAASNMELVAVAQGLGVLYCGFFVRAAQGDAKLKDLLGLDESQEVKVCLVLGNPDVTYHRTVPRKPAIIHWV